MNTRTKYKRGDNRLLFYISVKVEQDLNHLNATQFLSPQSKPPAKPEVLTAMDYRTYSMTTRRLGSVPVEWVVMFSISCKAA